MAVKETINKGWTPVSTGDGFYITTTQSQNDALSAATVAPVTTAIPASTRLSGSKILVFIDVDVVSGGAATATDVFMEMSPDGVNWTSHEDAGEDYIELSTTFNPKVLGWTVLIADLQEFRSPYYRIGFNSQAAALHTGMRFKMGYSYAK